MTTQDEPWPTWFLVGLFMVALALLATALILLLRGPRGAGVPTAAAPARVVLATETAGARLATEGTLTPASVARGAGGAGELPSATEVVASHSVQPALTPAAAVGATGTPVPRPPATPAVAPAATATSAVVMPLVAPGEAGDAGAVEGQLALEGRTLFSGITLLANGTSAALTDASGSFRLTVPAGRYTVTARHPGYVTIEATDVEVRAGDTTRLPLAVLRAGDTDADGDIDLFDVVRCVINLGQERTTHADVNSDGKVDLRDVILTQRNYRGVSPAPWRVSDQ